MALDSVGYDGTIDETEFSRWSGFYGGPPVVAGYDDWRVEPVSAGDRTVVVKAGRGYGYGVADTEVSDTNLQLDVVAAGVRWDAIVCRRDWATNTSAFVAVSGGSTAALPPGLMLDWTDQGVEADQVLALVQVTAGQQIPTQVIDLRAFASKIITVTDLRAVPEASIGTEVVRSTDGSRFRRVRDTSGSLVWQPANQPFGVDSSAAFQISTSPRVSGWSGNPEPDYLSVYREPGSNMVQLVFRARRTGGNLAAGNRPGGMPIADIPDPRFHPLRFQYVAGYCPGGAATFRIGTNGQIDLLSNTAPITQSSSAHSVWFSLTYFGKAL